VGLAEGLAALATKDTNVPAKVVRLVILVLILVGAGVFLGFEIKDRDGRLLAVEAKAEENTKTLAGLRDQMQDANRTLCRIGLALKLDRAEVCHR